METLGNYIQIHAARTQLCSIFNEFQAVHGETDEMFYHHTKNMPLFASFFMYICVRQKDFLAVRPFGESITSHKIYNKYRFQEEVTYWTKKKPLCKLKVWTRKKQYRELILINFPYGNFCISEYECWFIKPFS